jgi:hypothetical protein
MAAEKKISQKTAVKLLDLLIEEMARMIKRIKYSQKRLDADLAEMQTR